MAKIPRFHQFVHLERGPVNTAIIDFLRGNVFQEKNEIIDAFWRQELGGLDRFLEAARREELIIEIDRERWIPQIVIDKKVRENELSSFNLVLEEGVDLETITALVEHVHVPRVTIVGIMNMRSLRSAFTLSEIVFETQKYRECMKKCRINREMASVTQDRYGHNAKYNSCWGRQIAIMKDGRIRPCLFADISIGQATDAIPDILTRVKDYWLLTKDRVEKCRDCELRYACQDCRVASIKTYGNLYGENPYCRYDPRNGTWGSC